MSAGAPRVTAPEGSADALVERLDALAEALASPDASTRKAAGEALVALGDPRAEGYLRKLAGSRDGVARYWAKLALKELARATTEARAEAREAKAATERRALRAHLALWWGAHRRGLVAAALLAAVAFAGRAARDAWRTFEAQAPARAAETLFLAGRAAEAEAAYRAFVERNPRDLGSLARLADLAFAAGNAARARRLVEALEAADAAAFEFRRMAGKRLLARPADAVPLYRALAAERDDPQVTLEFALALHRSGDTAEAALTLGRLLAARPAFLAARLAAAELAADRGDAAGAVAEAERAVALAPGHPDALFRLGLARLDRGDPGGAAAAFEAALARRPADASCAFNLGLAHERNGRDDEAATAYGIALAIDPGHVPARLNLAVLHGRNARPDLEYTEYRALAERAPGIAAAPFNAGVAALAAGDAARAARLFERALALAPRHGPARLNAGLLAEGRYRALLPADPAAAEKHRREAVAHFRAALADRPQDPAAAARLAALGETPR